MDVVLHTHNAKHVCEIPYGLQELCADISREVIRSQPKDIYCFIAEYLDTLMITRENAKVAAKVVENVLLKGQQVVNILSSTGLRLEDIAVVAPRLQETFRAYLEAVSKPLKECGCEEDLSEMDQENENIVGDILRRTGATYRQAAHAAVKIQALFRGHYERMLLAEKRGEVQWQRAVARTVHILKKLRVSNEEATQAVRTIQIAYRNYYRRKCLKQEKIELTSIELKEKPQEDSINVTSNLSYEKAHMAAIVIQTAYRKLRNKNNINVKRIKIDSELISNESVIEDDKVNILDSDSNEFSKSTDTEDNQNVQPHMEATFIDKEEML